MSRSVAVSSSRVVGRVAVVVTLTRCVLSSCRLAMVGVCVVDDGRCCGDGRGEERRGEARRGEEEGGEGV